MASVEIKPPQPQLDDVVIVINRFQAEQLAGLLAVHEEHSHSATSLHTMLSKAGVRARPSEGVRIAHDWPVYRVLF